MTARPGRPMFGPLQTKDGYLNLAVASERTFRDLARAAGREDWLTDARFARYADRRCWALEIRARIDPALVDRIEEKLSWTPNCSRSSSAR